MNYVLLLHIYLNIIYNNKCVKCLCSFTYIVRHYVARTARRGVAHIYRTNRIYQIFLYSKLFFFFFSRGKEGSCATEARYPRVVKKKTPRSCAYIINFRHFRHTAHAKWHGTSVRRRRRRGFTHIQNIVFFFMCFENRGKVKESYNATHFLFDYALMIKEAAALKLRRRRDACIRRRGALMTTYIFSYMRVRALSFIMAMMTSRRII